MSTPKVIRQWYLKLWSWPENVRDVIGKTGDALQYILPILTLVYCVVAFGLTSQYTLIFAGYFLLCVGTSTLLKALFNNQRPSEWDDVSDHPEQSPEMNFEWSPSEGNSFCSGHTMSAIAGALPWTVINVPISIVMITLASFVGFSRIVDKAHWLRDVVTSEIIATLYFVLFVIFIL